MLTSYIVWGLLGYSFLYGDNNQPTGKLSYQSSSNFASEAVATFPTYFILTSDTNLHGAYFVIWNIDILRDV